MGPDGLPCYVACGTGKQGWQLAGWLEPWVIDCIAAGSISFGVFVGSMREINERCVKKILVNVFLQEC